MKVATSNLHSIINDYLMQVIVPKVPNTLTKFGLAFASSYISESFIDSFLYKYISILNMLNIIDENNMIDLDLCKTNAHKALSECNGTVQFMGYVIDKDDIDAIYKIAQSYV